MSSVCMGLFADNVAVFLQLITDKQEQAFYILLLHSTYYYYMWISDALTAPVKCILLNNIHVQCLCILCTMEKKTVPNILLKKISCQQPHVKKIYETVEKF